MSMPTVYNMNIARKLLIRMTGDPVPDEFYVRSIAQIFDNLDDEKDKKEETYE